MNDEQAAQTCPSDGGLNSDDDFPKKDKKNPVQFTGD